MLFSSKMDGKIMQGCLSIRSCINPGSYVRGHQSDNYVKWLELGKGRGSYVEYRCTPLGWMFHSFYFLFETGGAFSS